MPLSEEQSKLQKIISSCKYEDGNEIHFDALHATITSSILRSIYYNQKTLYDFIVVKLKSSEFSLLKDTGKINLLCLAAILHEQEGIDLGIYFFEGAGQTELKSCGLERKALSYYGALREDFIAAKNANSVRTRLWDASQKMAEAAQYVADGVFLAAAPVVSGLTGNIAALFSFAKKTNGNSGPSSTTPASSL